jgi:hypothetical protein
MMDASALFMAQKYTTMHLVPSCSDNDQIMN